ncbi:MAG TPA: hypothetical protein VJZ32_07485 [Candidatus Bathyarchaeia archaeon]|nr:hypothetical protein [Candidatus Bathyarchaeia archaeon]
MKTSQKIISLVSLAAASVAVVIAASREPKVQAAFSDAQINFGKWYKENVAPLTKRLNAQKIRLTL